MVHDLLEIKNITRGRIIQGNPQDKCHGFSTDTRTIRPSQAFIALVGQKFDAHNFLDQAVKKGAGLLIVQFDRIAKVPTGVPVVAVKDTLKSLGDLAKDWRSRFHKDVIAVTGSTGKTTTKEMIAHILAGYHKVLRNPGNLNNLVGLPLSLLKMNKGHHAAVLEMGMNRPGEIARLTRIADPDVGLITNIAAVHIEGLKTIGGVAKAKAELMENMNESATLIVNLDDRRICSHAKIFPGRMIGFCMGKKPVAGLDAHMGKMLSVRLMDHRTEARPNMSPNQRFHLCRYKGDKRIGQPVEFCIKSFGLHDAGNALSAAATVMPLGVSLEESAKRLESFKTLSRRGVLRRKKGLMIIDDSYNANPRSVESALKSMSTWKGQAKGIAVLGQMLELGPRSEQFHREVGGMVLALGVSMLIAQGSHAEAMVDGAIKAGMPAEMAKAVKTNQQAVNLLTETVKPGDWILVKGSRGMGMENIVEDLLQK